MKNVKVQVAHDKRMLVSGELDSFDLCILCMTPWEFTNEEEQSVVDFVDKGKNLFGIHSVICVDEKNTKYINLIGGRFLSHSPYHEFQVKIENCEHPLISGLGDFRISDELYVMDRASENASILATAVWERKVHPMVYVKSYGKGEVLYNAMGHDRGAFHNFTFQKLIIQGIKWGLS